MTGSENRKDRSVRGFESAYIQREILTHGARSGHSDVRAEFDQLRNPAPLPSTNLNLEDRSRADANPPRPDHRCTHTPRRAFECATASRLGGFQSPDGRG